MLLAATLVVMACLPSGSSLTLLLFVLFSTTISAVSNLVGILPAESFPTDIRSLGVGFATAMSRLGAAVSTGLLPWVLAQWGMQVTLLLPGDSVVGWFCCDRYGHQKLKPSRWWRRKCRRCE